MIDRNQLRVAVLAVLAGLLISQSGSACTTAVISGKATADGRPILWKNRDTGQTHNELVIFDGGRYRVLAVVDANKRSSVWMGVNAAGLCIENSLSKDLNPEESTAEGLGNGQFMKHILQNCANVDEVRQTLEETNSTGRRTRANFGVIDSNGGAAIFEAGPDSFSMFDVNDPAVAPRGYLVRTNFAPSAHGLSGDPEPTDIGKIYSSKRYLQACRRLDELEEAPIHLDFVLRNLTRDLSDERGEPFAGSVNGASGELPATIVTSSTISRSTTVSAAVFHGVKPGEDPALTTMWTILGDPKFSIAVPGWASMDAVADPLADKYGGELGEVAITLRGWSVDESSAEVNTKYLPGIWTDLWPTENRILQRVRSRLSDWRSSGANASQMSQLHQEAAELAMSAISRELDELKRTVIASGSTAIDLQNDAFKEPTALADTPKPATTREAYIGVYDDAGSGKSTEKLISRLRAMDGVYIRRLTADEIRSGKLNGLDILVHPGGSGGGQGRELGAAGRDVVKDFVRDGGGYIGFCAGAYLATSHYSWSLDLLDAKVFDRKHWARGNGRVKIRLSEAGKSVLGAEADVTEIYYGQGPLLVPAGDPDLPDYQVLASYESGVAKKGAPKGAMIGTTAIALGRFGKGQVLCFSPHPELTDGLDAFVSRAVQQVCPSSRNAVAPPSQPDLQNTPGPASISKLTPDISQRGFPNGNYCAPCAATNLLFQFENRDLLKLPTDFGAIHGSTDRAKQRQMRLALLLGDDEHMKTLTRNGTNRYRLVNGMDKFVREACNAELSIQYLGIRSYSKELLDQQIRPRILPVIGIPQMHHVRQALDAGKGVMILFGSYRRNPDRPEKLERLGGHYVAVVGHGINPNGQPSSHYLLLHDSNDGYDGIKFVSAQAIQGPAELWQDDVRLARSNRLVQLNNAPIRKDGRIAILETIFDFTQSMD